MESIRAPVHFDYRFALRMNIRYLAKGHRQAITPKLYLSVFFDVFLKIEVQNLTFLQDCYNKSKFFPNSGKLSLVPYTKDFGRITHF